MPISLLISVFKVSNNLHNNELKGLKVFMREHNVRKGYIVCLEERIRKIAIDEDKEILVMPIKEFLSCLWEENLGNKIK